MFRAKNVDVLHGNLFKSIIIYSIPIILMGLIQKLFNAVDIMVLGMVADTNAVASVGVTSNVVSLCVDSFFGISIGVRVVLAKIIGADEILKAKKTISTSIYTALGLGVIAAVAGYFFTAPFLNITNCPEECYSGAVAYLRIYMLAAPAVLLYNYGAAIISVSGDTQRPMYYMIISGTLNIVLNFILCFVLKEKVAAVAIATAASQIVGAVLVIVRIFKMKGICRMRLRAMRWSTSAFLQIMANGLPIGIYHALYPVANLQIQAQVNSFGAATMAGHTACTQIESIINPIISAPWTAALATFAGQNIGAKQGKRVTKSIFYCFAISASLGLVFGVVCSIFYRPLTMMFVSDEAAIYAVSIRLKYTLLPICISCINGILSRILQTFGYSFLSTINSVVFVLVFRVFWTHTVFANNPTLDILYLCYLVSWLLCLVSNILYVIYVYKVKIKNGILKI